MIAGSRVTGLALCASFVFLSALPARGQSLWLPLSVIGYGGLGGGAGFLLCLDCDYDAGGGVILGGAIVGLIGGFILGNEAVNDAEDGVIRESMLWAARIGTVAGFTALSSLGAAWRIDNQTDNEEGEDERTFRNFALVGAGVGIVFEFLYERGFDPPLQIGAVADPGSPAGGFVGLAYRNEW